VPTPFLVDDTVARVVRPAVLWWGGATVTASASGLGAVIDTVVAAVVAAPPADTGVVREMYRRIGLDPTKTRPSNEALLRRVRRGDPFPRVNALVDAVNLCSLECQLPYGVYDRAAVEGDITLRLGRDGEAYDGIRKDTVHVAGRLTVADARGPFGNPTSDSARAMVTPSTRDALVVVYAPEPTPRDRLRAVLDRTAAVIAGAVGGHEQDRWIA
jgi:DNA/RNA-binding domain of Phe-tRNA-synthetase-like protein